MAEDLKRSSLLCYCIFCIGDVLMPTRKGGLDQRKEQESGNNVQPRMAKRRKGVTE